MDLKLLDELDFHFVNRPSTPEETKEISDYIQARNRECEREFDKVMGVEYFFDPVELRSFLAMYPNLTSAFVPLLSKDSAATSIPGIRKSSRLIFSMLGSTSPEFRTRWASLFESAFEDGVDRKELLSRGRTNFDSVLGEIIVTDYLRKSGMEVESMNRLVANGSRKGDILLRHGDLSANVEIFSPADFRGYAEFIETLCDQLRWLDTPHDYNVSLRFERWPIFNDHHELVRINPWLAESYFSLPQNQKDVTQKASEIIMFALQNDVEGHEDHVFIEEINLRVCIRVNSFGPCASRFPRRICGTGTSSSGLAPEAMFRRMLTGKVRSKMKRRQAAAGPERYSGLIVYLGGLHFAFDVADEPFATMCKNEIAGVFKGEKLRGDFIAFLAPDNSAPHRNRISHLLHGKNFAVNHAKQLFGEFSHEILCE